MNNLLNRLLWVYLACGVLLFLLPFSMDDYFGNSYFLIFIVIAAISLLIVATIEHLRYRSSDQYQRDVKSNLEIIKKKKENTMKEEFLESRLKGLTLKEKITLAEKGFEDGFLSSFFGKTKALLISVFAMALFSPGGVFIAGLFLIPYSIYAGEIPNNIGTWLLAPLSLSIWLYVLYSTLLHFSLKGLRKII